MEESAAPIVILSYGIEPEASEVEGKFLQLTWHGREFLVFAPRGLHRFHNYLLAHFLGDQGIPHHWADEQTLRIDAPELRVIGGGKFQLNTTEKTLALSDNSQAYGRFNERGLKEKIVRSESPWRNFFVTINP